MKLWLKLREPPDVFGVVIRDTPHKELNGTPVVSLKINDEQCIVLTIATAQQLRMDLHEIITSLKAKLN